jgi:DNA helicase HerA-like ATPase
VEPDGRGRVSVLELADVQDKPALWSTFMLWLLARLYGTLPEVGDVDKPKLVFFLDEAHLLFDGSSKAFRDQVEQVVRLIRSKGVGVFFVTQSPKDVPGDILGQLGNRVQHALRAFTPDDAKALKAAARTFPKTPFYDVEETLTTLGIGEALVTVLSPTGAPTPPFATRLIPPASRMGPLTPDELRQRLAASAQVRDYAEPIDRESAREILEARLKAAAGIGTVSVEASQPVPTIPSPAPAPAPARGRAPKPEASAFEKIVNSPVARTVAGQLTRTLLGALLGTSSTRRRRR